MKNNALFSPGLRKIWIAVMTFMAITGMGQMPIFKRYYVADIPGLGWLADPYTVHWAHYLGAAALMALACWAATIYLLHPDRPQLKPNRIIRIILLGLIVITGYLRVAKNMPDVAFSPLVTLLIDQTHLLFAALLGVVALFGRNKNKRTLIEQS